MKHLRNNKILIVSLTFMIITFGMISLQRMVSDYQSKKIHLDLSKLHDEDSASKVKLSFNEKNKTAQMKYNLDFTKKNKKIKPAKLTFMQIDNNKEVQKANTNIFSYIILIIILVTGFSFVVYFRKMEKR